jgi:hypothetical protein
MLRTKLLLEELLMLSCENLLVPSLRSTINLRHSEKTQLLEQQKKT